MKKLYLSWRANLIESQTRVTRKNVVEWCYGCWVNSCLGKNKEIGKIFR